MLTVQPNLMRHHVSAEPAGPVQDGSPRVAMHGAILRWPPKSDRLLVVFRLSDENPMPADEAPEKPVAPANGGTHHLTSSLHYAELDQTLLGRRTSDELGFVPRPLPLASPPTVQLLAGPEDGRLFMLGGKACVLYNDVLHEPEAAAGVRSNADQEPQQKRLARRWLMRRGMYISCLSRRPPGHGEPRGSADTSSRGGDGLIHTSAPILLRPSASVLRAVGTVSDVEKNWVPFVHNGTLHLSYSLDPHYVLRVHPAALAAAETKAKAGGDGTGAAAELGPPANEVVAELAYASRFAEQGTQHGKLDRVPPRPAMRGGTPPVRIPGGRYLAFMHTVWKRNGRSLYAVAAYAFSASPPFAIESITPPFTLAGHATPYPIGLVASKRHLLLSYGVADREWYIAKLDKAALLESLVPVRTDETTHDVVPSPTRSTDESLTGLPRQLHFFRNAPDGVKDLVVAEVRARGS